VPDRTFTTACSALPLEIERNTLTRCFYLCIRCHDHGEIRMAAACEPHGECFPCPICERPSWFVVLGEGGTHRALPFWDKVKDTFSFGEGVGQFWREQKSRQAPAEKVHRNPCASIAHLLVVMLAIVLIKRQSDSLIPGGQGAPAGRGFFRRFGLEFCVGFEGRNRAD